MKKFTLFISFVISFLFSCNPTTTKEINSETQGSWEVVSTIYFPEFKDSMEITSYWERGIPAIKLGDTLSFAIVGNSEELYWKLIEINPPTKKFYVFKTFKGIVRHLYENYDF